MRILNETDAFMEAKERYHFEGTKRYDVEKLDAFLDGFEFAETKIKPMFVLFGNWCVENYVSFNDHDGNLYWLKFPEIRKTTEELFELWLEEQIKK